MSKKTPFLDPFTITNFSQNTVKPGETRTQRLSRVWVKKGTKKCHFWHFLDHFLTGFGQTPLKTPKAPEMVEKNGVFLATLWVKKPFKRAIFQSKTASKRVTQNAHPCMPSIQISAFQTFCDHFLTHRLEHVSKGLENLAWQHTVLGGKLSTFTGQWGGQIAILHCSRPFEGPKI